MSQSNRDIVKLRGELSDREFISQYLFIEILKREPREDELEEHLKGLITSSREAKEREFLNCEERFIVTGMSGIVTSISCKRVALLICGHFRNFNDFKIKNIYKWIVGNYSGQNVDVFVHSWFDTGKRGHGPWIDEQSSVQPDFTEILGILKPKKVKIENNREMLSTFSMLNKGDTFRKLYYGGGQDCQSNDFGKYIVSQLYSIWQANNLKRDYEKETGFTYDMTVKIRADHPPFRLDLASMLAIQADDTIYANATGHIHPGGGKGCLSCDEEFRRSVARKHDEHTNDICDVFIYGPSALMDVYAELYQHCNRLLDEFWEHNKKQVRCDCIRSLKYGEMVCHGHCIETIYKCVYPERMIREYMKNYKIRSDPGYIVALY